MRTDAMLFSLSGGNEMRKSGRMDRVPEDRKDSVAMESGKALDERSKTAMSDFRQTYERVARNNRDASSTAKNSSARVQSGSENRRAAVAHSKDEPMVERKNDDVARAEETERVPENDRQDSVDRDCNPEDHQAFVIIREALMEISQALQLNIDDGLGDLSLNTISDETVEQFAEILQALKNITGLFDGSIAQKQSIELGATVLDTQKMTELGQMVRTGQFRIEIALSMLGISEQTFERIAMKNQQPFAGGIPQAINPSELFMPAVQVEQVFGKVLTSPQSQISELARKVAELVKENGTRVQSTLVSMKVIMTGQVIEQGRLAEPGQFDSQTMRGMLKIDTPQQLVAAQNEQAANDSKKQDLPGISGQFIAKELSEMSKQATQEVVAVSESFSATQSLQSQSGELKMPGQVMKTIEQSVVNQVVEKLDTAVRSGVNEIRIQLRPEALGEIRLRIRVEGDVVMARIQVENQQVKQIVESNMQSLKDTLAQQNLQAGSFEVNVGGNWDSEAQAAWQQAHRQHGEAGKSPHGAEADDTGESQIQESDVAPGHETGRRFGSNTMEYFA